MNTDAERFNAAVGAQLRAEIAAHGGNVRKAAEATKISRSSLIKYLDGERPIPVSAVYLIGALWHVPAHVILERALNRLSEESEQ